MKQKIINLLNDDTDGSGSIIKTPPLTFKKKYNFSLN
jgi:hypothetical protein